MILIKIDSLSTQELRNIAEQENVENYDSLKREDLITILQEIYEEDEDIEEGSNFNRRFIFGITDYREIDKDVVELPGVEELPESYPNTEIHILHKNPNWAYCYWNIAPQDILRLENLEINELLLRVNILNNGKTGCYDIPVSIEDRDWTLSLPEDGGSCFVSLMVEEEGEIYELCHSKALPLIDSYWLKHIDEIKDNDNLIKIYLSLLTTKEGILAESPLLDEILEKAEEAFNE